MIAGVIAAGQRVLVTGGGGLPVTSGLLFDLDPEFGVTTGTTLYPVTSVADQSASALTYAPVTGGDRPRWVPNVVAGHAAFDFDFTGAFPLQGSATLASVKTLVIVADHTASTFNASNESLVSTNGGAQNIMVAGSGGSTWLTTGGNFVNGTATNTIGTLNQVNVFRRENSGGLFTTQQLRLGNGPTGFTTRQWRGRVFRALAYDRVLTSGEAASLEAALAGMYQGAGGATVALPVTSGLVMDLDPDVGVTAPALAPVATVTDQSPSATVWTPASGTPPGLATVGGILAFDFTAERTPPLVSGASVTGIRTLVMVASHDAATFVDFDSLLTAQTGDNTMVGNDGTANWFSTGGNFVNGVATNAIATLNQVNVFRREGAVAFISDTYRLGSGPPGFPERAWKGHVYRALAYNRILTSGEVTSLEAHLTSRYVP